MSWPRVHLPEFAAEPVWQRGIDFNINFDKEAIAFEGKFCRVMDAATGLMLIRRPTIQRLYEDHAYLTCVNDMPEVEGMSMKTYCAIFDCMIDPDTRRYLSEDYAFCRRVQWSGMEVWAMLTCVVGHIGALHVDASNPRMIEPLTERFRAVERLATVDDVRREYPPR